jgi:hypothetical protein
MFQHITTSIQGFGHFSPENISLILPRLKVLNLAFFISGVALNSLQGFRFFGASVVIWILTIGIVLYKQK